MTLPSSGQLSASAINVELGRSSSAEFSIKTACEGGYATINVYSTNRPTGVAPFSYSQFHGYNHAATYSGPTLDSVSASEDVPIGCGVNWQVRVYWNTTGTDDTNYEVQIFTYGGGQLVASLTTADSSWAHDTGISGDALLTDYTYNQRYTVKIVRKSDGLVVQTADTGIVSTTAGDPC